MTPEEVRERLGLRPWTEIELEAEVRRLFEGRDAPFWEQGRRSGRTTRMLVEAVAAMSTGQTAIVVTQDLGMGGHALRFVADALQTLGVQIRHSGSRNVRPAPPEWGSFFIRSARQEMRLVTRNWVGVDHLVTEMVTRRPEPLPPQPLPKVLPPPPGPAIVRRTAYEFLLEEGPWD